MIIQKIFNNNACMVEDENENEIILMGKGIAFQKKLMKQKYKNGLYLIQQN